MRASREGGEPVTRPASEHPKSLNQASSDFVDLEVTNLKVLGYRGTV
jgi:hypothetical protein